MKAATQKKEKKARRRARIRAKIAGTASRPRLAVFKSNQFIYAQLIDDENGTTLAAADSRSQQGTRSIGAAEVGTTIAKTALAKGIKAAVFDRGGFQYTGVVAVLAEAARKEGLVF